VSDFNEVELHGIGNLTIQQTDSESLTIKAEDNIIPYLKSEAANNRLTLYIENGVSIRATKPINYRLTVKDLRDLKLRGSGTINVENINTNDLKITTTGSGNVSASIDTNTLEVILSGAGDAKMDGKTDSQDVNVSGSGRYQAENLQSKEAKIDISGSGSATLNVSDALDARIAGIGSVEYTGDPTVSKQISGIGELRKR
jgi:carbon monoxide dehydrogenase subunit G